MPLTVIFLDQKLYQSISFDADIKFSDISEYAKKIWILKEYKKADGKTISAITSSKRVCGMRTL